MKSHTCFFKLPVMAAALSLATTFSFAQTPPSTPAPATPPAAPAPAADFGDNTSTTLTTKAWHALEKKDYASVKVYTDRCITTYKDKAIGMQASLKDMPGKDTASSYWALNDVGTCYFIAGKAADESGDKATALADYKFLADNLSYAQCWDPQGWFWGPAAAARKRMIELSMDSK